MKYKFPILILLIVVLIFINVGDVSADNCTKDANMDELTACIIDQSKVVYQALIGIGVAASIFILPYVGFLLASGNENNVQKAKDLLTSWLYGLLLLLLSGTIISIVGSDLLGIY